jgi:hypothetical protein
MLLARMADITDYICQDYEMVEKYNRLDGDLSIVGRLWPLSYKTLVKHGYSAVFHFDPNYGSTWSYNG